MNIVIRVSQSRRVAYETNNFSCEKTIKNVFHQ